MARITCRATRVGARRGVSEGMNKIAAEVPLADALSCDLATGLCGVGVEETQRVAVTYVTDPICSACWAMEPAWRSVEYTFGDLLDVRHVYGGLLPSWDGFADAGNGIHGHHDVAHHWREMAEHTGQAMNVSVWEGDPIASSFPASMVLTAARDIAPARDGLMLRRLREELFVNGRNISRPEVWSDAAEKADIDPRAIQERLDDGRAESLFAADLQTARALGATAFPTLIVEAGGDRRTLRGVQPAERLAQVIAEAAGVQQPRPSATLEEAVAFLDVATTAEYAALLGTTREDAVTALESVGLRARQLPGGAVWTP